MPYSRVLNIGLGSSFALLAMAAVGLAPSAALATTTYASASGSNSNACTASAPCLTISNALTKAVSGGAFARVVVLGPGTFSENVKVTTTGGAEIVGDGNGYIAIAPASGVGVTISAGPSSNVRIANLQIVSNNANGTIGLKVLTASTVDIENVEIHGFATAGLESEVSTAPYTAMTISNSFIGDNGCLLVHPQGGANPEVLLVNTRIRNCGGIGVMVDSSATSTAGSAVVILKNSSVADGHLMVEANSVSASGFAMVTLENTIVENSPSGLLVNGPKSNAILNNASITNNEVGVTNTGGTVNSYGNNNIFWNGTNISGTVSRLNLQ